MSHTVWEVASTSYDTCADVSISVQEGAADGSLGSGPFKLLNAGLSGASLIHLLVLAPLLGGEHAGPFLLPLLGTWGASFALSSANLLRGDEA